MSNAYILSLFGQLNLIWLAFPIAELVAVIVSTILFNRIKKHLDIIMEAH